MKMFLMLIATFTFMAGASADCVSVNSVSNYEMDGDNLILHARGEEWLADVGVCPELRWADTIGFDTFSSAWLCDGDSVIVYDYSRRPVDRCHIWSLEKRE